MVGRRLKSRFSVLVLLAISVISWRRARTIPFGLRNKFLWISVIAMAFMLRQIFQSPSSKLVANHAKVGKKATSTKDVDLDEYDFIIVGGGSAGCVMAARLSEDPSVRVLVLEAGGSGKSILLTRIPLAFSLLFRNSKHVYQLWTEPQPDAKQRRKFWPRAKMLGGCSSINAQMAHYGAPQDFDEWGKIIQDEAWAWKNFSKYFKKFETYKDDSRYPEVNSSIKGSKGPVRVGYFSHLADASRDFVQACMNIGVPYSPDFNTDAGTRGVNRIMTYIDENRVRVSSETAYFTQDVLARPNLTVVVNATVTKILFEKNNDEIKTVGVEFAKSSKGQRYTVRSKEVILAAGAIHSPHVLLLSGVGPAEHLKNKNIPVVRDLPGVGSNLVDHPVVDLYFKNKHASSKYVRPRSISDVFKLLFSTYEYLVHKRGVLTGNAGEAAAFIRSDDPALFPESEFKNKVQDSTSGDDGPDLEVLTTPIAYKDHSRFMFPMDTFSIHTCLLRPMSKGTLRLRTNDPFDLPAADPRYLSAPEDIEKIRRGLRFISKVAKQEPLTEHIDLNFKHSLLDSDIEKSTDEELEDLIRERIETLYHPAGTCRMAPESDNGVVDSHLRVYGIKGLRVADASVFPEIVSGHTAGACLAIGEHTADIIKSERALMAKS